VRGLRLGQKGSGKTEPGGNLPDSFFMGGPVKQGATASFAQESPGRPDPDLTQGIGGEDHQRCVARSVPGPDAQSDLGAGRARGLKLVFDAARNYCSSLHQTANV